MIEKVIGILGGMGPEATLDYYGKIIRYTPAAKDQEHLRVIIDSNPKVPDRTAAVLGQGESPVPLMVSGLKTLERAGADFAVIPCVSAHVFLEDLQAQAGLPILSVFDAVAETITQEYPQVKTVGLLSTSGTIQDGRFQKRLAESGLKTVIPEKVVQEKVMAAIYTIKDSQSTRSRPEVTAELTAAAQTLISSGAEGIIAGCTEIPLALSQNELEVPYFDALTMLALAAIRRAGRQPA